MLFELLIAATAIVPADTTFAPGLVLLGQLIQAPTYESEPVVDESLPETPALTVTPRLSFTILASMPAPQADLPGLPGHSVYSPSEIGLTQAELDDAVRSVNESLYRGQFPGASLAIGRWDRPVLERGIGTLDGMIGSPAVDPDHTIYDLASLTKVIATTTAVMLLVEDNRMSLDAPVSTYLPQFSGGNKDRVTVRHLLTHTSGLPAGANTSGATPEESLQRAISTPLIRRPGQRVEYSDIGFVVLWAAAEAANMASLDKMLEMRVFEPLGMTSTNFRPGESCVRCAPTDERPGYRGVVHDPISRRLGGITGNAGLFSTAHDLGRFAAMLIGGGELDGVRVLERSTIETFTTKQKGAASRALGWDTQGNSFGHTGFTGTSVWIDPVRGTWAVLLSNRTFQEGPNRMQALRREVNDRIAISVERARDDR